MVLLQGFSKRCVERCLKLISDCNSLEDARRLLKMMDLFDFSDFITEHKFKNKLIQSDLFKEPEKITIGYETVEEQPGCMVNIEHHMVMNDIGFQLRKFLETDTVLESILQNQRLLDAVPEGVIKHFVNGKSWKRIQQKYLGKVIMPLFLYNDDFQVDNQCGSHSGAHSVSMFYLSIPTLPSYMVSKLDSIFTALAVKSADTAKYGNYSPLHTLTNALIPLEENGLELFAGTPKHQTVYIVMCKVLGDNLGLHAVCGYKKNFRGDMSCITCETPASIQRKSWTVNPNLLRTVEKYEKYFEEGTYGIFGLNERCVLNTAPSFHVAENLIADIMHDIQLGVGKFSMEDILNHFINKQHYITIEELNARINSFSCGYKEAANKPGIIRDTHIRDNGNLHVHANESLFLLRYLPIIVYGKVPFEDPVYKYLLDCIDMVDDCFSDQFDMQSIADLKEKISNNRKMYLDVFQGHLKPKDHNMLHYSDIIEESGPLKYISSIRFESKHQVILSYTKNSHNRRNICYSICKKQGFEFAYFLLKGKEKFLSKITPSSKKGSQITERTTTFMINRNLKLETYCSGN